MKCNFCNKIFSNKSSLNVHQKNTKYCLKLQDKTELSNFSCKYCDKSFTSKQTLSVHYTGCKNKGIQDAIQEERSKLQKESSNLVIQNKPLVLNDVVIIIREDGYVNLTQLCKAGSKEFKAWFRNKNTETYLQVLSSSVQICTDDLIKYETGSNENRATWGHPQVAINIAQWISPQFDVQVSKWIFELTLTGKVELGKEKSNKELENIYQEKINNLQNKLKDYENTTFNGNINMCPIEYYTKDVVYFFKFKLPEQLHDQYINKYPNINNEQYKCIEFGVTSNIEERIKSQKRDKKKDELILIHLVELDKRYTASKMEYYIKTVSKQMNINFDYEKSKECIIANEHEFNLLVNKIEKGIENIDDEDKDISLDTELKKLETTCTIELRKLDIELEVKKLEKEELFKKIESATDLFKNKIIDFEQYKELISF